MTVRFAQMLNAIELNPAQRSPVSTVSSASFPPRIVIRTALAQKLPHSSEHMVCMGDDCVALKAPHHRIVFVCKI